MEIEENHTYYVGEDKLLVHNEYDLKNLVKIYDDYAKWITDSNLKASFNETLDAIKKSGNEELLKEFDNSLKDIKENIVDGLKNLLGETNEKLGKGFEGVNKAENIITDGSHIQNGKLKPNSIYKAGEHDYIYKTNQDGLIINAKTDKLELKNHEGRLKHDANTLGKQEGDHAGHLFGDRFGGSPELDNVVSQAKKVNLSEYKVIENQWAKALKKGQKVTVDINVNYLPGVERPISFDVFYTINGVPFFQTITQ